jgi:hypothetical protein
MTGKTNAVTSISEDFNFLAISKNNANGTDKGTVQSPVWRYNGVTYQRNTMIQPTLPNINTPIASISRQQNGILNVVLRIKCKATGFTEADGVYDIGATLTVNTTTSATETYLCAFLVGV